VFDALPGGASLVQGGGGPQLDAAALLAGLASGRVDNAILDGTEPEPLPGGHPFWAYPRIRITPHIARATRHDTAVEAGLANFACYRGGQRKIGVVERARGY
jgi:Phosphoglycerate dehydrogenase and related dehydrogenases